MRVHPALGWAVLASLAIAVAGIALAPRTQVLAPPVLRAPPPSVEGPWVSYVATTDVCPGGDDPGAAPPAQERTMLCLVDYARAQAGLQPVAAVSPLLRSSAFKAGDIATCGRFDHDPCGTGSGRVFELVLYGAGASAYATGENIAMVSVEIASPRHVLNGWLNSTGHRENLFRSDWTEQGVALLPQKTVDGHPRMNVWVSQFGYREG